MEVIAAPATSIALNVLSKLAVVIGEPIFKSINEKVNRHILKKFEIKYSSTNNNDDFFGEVLGRFTKFRNSFIKKINEIPELNGLFNELMHACDKRTFRYFRDVFYEDKIVDKKTRRVMENRHFATLSKKEDSIFRTIWIFNLTILLLLDEIINKSIICNKAMQYIQLLSQTNLMCIVHPKINRLLNVLYSTDVETFKNGYENIALFNSFINDIYLMNGMEMLLHEDHFLHILYRKQDQHVSMLTPTTDKIGKVRTNMRSRKVTIKY